MNGPEYPGSDWLLAPITDITLFDSGSGPEIYGITDYVSTSAGSYQSIIVKWNGSRWVPLPDSPMYVLALAVFDDGTGPALYATGKFTISSVSAFGIARWNGTSWSALGSGLGGAGYALTSFDDGTGPALYVGGTFLTAGGVPASKIARWKNGAWSKLGGGLSTQGLNQAVVFALVGGSLGTSGRPMLFAAGEFAFIAGHSGAGKSTLLKLIPAIERPSSGAVLVNGQNVGALKRAALPYLRRNLGLVFQDQKLLYDRSVGDNVMLPLAFSELGGREAERRVRAALEKVGLLAREKANPIQLSGGEQQRLAIARAVVNRPSVLIADEPTANLDAASAAAILEIFADFNKVGVTVLVATHDETLIGRFARRVLRLAGGKLVE